jgi:hypothetical protein
MIGRSSDLFGDSVCRANQPAEIFVQTTPPIIADERTTIFRTEDNMIVKAQVGCGHESERV